jgi:hypothetical protein
LVFFLEVCDSRNKDKRKSEILMDLKTLLVRLFIFLLVCLLIVGVVVSINYAIKTHKENETTPGSGGGGTPTPPPDSNPNPNPNLNKRQWYPLPQDYWCKDVSRCVNRKAKDSSTNTIDKAKAWVLDVLKPAECAFSQKPIMLFWSNNFSEFFWGEANDNESYERAIVYGGPWTAIVYACSEPRGK